MGYPPVAASIIASYRRGVKGVARSCLTHHEAWSIVGHNHRMKPFVLADYLGLILTLLVLLPLCSCVSRLNVHGRLDAAGQVRYYAQVNECVDDKVYEKEGKYYVRVPRCAYKRTADFCIASVACVGHVRGNAHVQLLPAQDKPEGVALELPSTWGRGMIDGHKQAVPKNYARNDAGPTVRPEVDLSTAFAYKRQAPLPRSECPIFAEKTDHHGIASTDIPSDATLHSWGRQALIKGAWLIDAPSVVPCTLLFSLRLMPLKWGAVAPNRREGLP